LFLADFKRGDYRLKKLLQFLFGKEADIFDEKGNVRHHLPEDKWKKWQQRYTQGDDYNWRNHSGKKSK